MGLRNSGGGERFVQMRIRQFVYSEVQAMDDNQTPGATGPAQVVSVSLPRPLFAAIDRFRRELDGLPSRPGAIRLLVEQALRHSAKVG
jgi:hypothetical protein